MTFEEYKWVDSAFNGVYNRNKLIPLKELKIPKKGQDHYTTYYRYNDEMLKHYQANNKSVAQFKGSHYSDYFPIDIDDPKNLENSLNITRTILNILENNYDLNLSNIRLFFSGAKGFHIMLPSVLFGFEPSTELSKIFKSIAKEILQDVKYDESIYDTTRLFRLPNTVNSKAKRYKIPLTIDDVMTLSSDEIKDLALNENKVEPMPISEILINKDLHNLYLKVKEDIKKPASMKAKKVPEIIKNGERDQTIFEIASSLRAKGLDEDEIYGALCETNKRCESPLTDKELQAKVKSACKYEKGSSKKCVPIKAEVEEMECIFNLDYCIYKKNTHKYVPKTMLANVESLLKHLGITIKYNEMSKEIDFDIKDLEEVSQDNLQNVCLEYLTDKCVEYDFQSFNPNRLSSIILAIADKNKYHPVKNYILKQYETHKGKCEGNIDKLCSIVKTPMSYDTNLKNTLIKTWLVSCVKAVFDKEGIKSEGCIVLQGEQGKFKTTFLKALSPKKEWFKDGQELNPSDKDIILQSIKYWMVELGELDSTFKRDMGKLKAFISKDYDEFRRSYARAESKYPRRTIFCASVNEIEFLKDATGNRRWWVIPVSDIDIKGQKEIDINKMWVEVYEEYLKGARHFLNKDEERQLAETNKSFNERNYVDTILESYFNWEDSTRYWMTSTDIFELLGYPANISLTKINQSLVKMGVENGVGRKRRMKKMPKLRQEGRMCNKDFSKLYEKVIF